MISRLAVLPDIGNELGSQLGQESLTSFADVVLASPPLPSTLIFVPMDLPDATAPLVLPAPPMILSRGD
jgi:hypothetical protein